MKTPTAVANGDVSILILSRWSLSKDMCVEATKSFAVLHMRQMVCWLAAFDNL